MIRSRTLAIAVLAALSTLVSPARAEDSAASEIKAGRAALAAEHPRAALAHYSHALTLAGLENREYRFAALIGMARAAVWLERYKVAEQCYRQAIPLAGNDEDRMVATAGLAQMLNVADRPRAAFEVASPFAEQSLANAVEAGRAALALGRQDQAVAALSAWPEALTSDIATTRLGGEVREQRDQIALQTKPVLLGAFEYIRDSDRLRTADTSIGTAFSAGAWWPHGPAPRWGIGAHRVTLDDASNRATIKQIQGGVEANLSRDFRFAAGLGAAQTGGWNYGLGNAQLMYRPTDDWGLEVGADRDAVKTLVALANRLSVRSMSVAGDVHLGNPVFATALVRQSFGDGNERDSATARLTFPDVMLVEGWPAPALQLYARYFEDSQPGLPGYFNPRRLVEQRFNIIFGTRLSPEWKLKMTLGPGHQSVDDTSSNTLTGELRLSGRWYGNARINLAANYGDTAAYASSGPGYRRTSFQAEVVVPW